MTRNLKILQRLKHCARCSYSFLSNSKTKYIRHFLKTHLNLSYRSFVCSICNAEGMRSSALDHFKTHHEITGWILHKFRDVINVLPIFIQWAVETALVQDPSWVELGNVWNVKKRTLIPHYYEITWLKFIFKYFLSTTLISPLFVKFGRAKGHLK